MVSWCGRRAPACLGRACEEARNEKEVKRSLLAAERFFEGLAAYAAMGLALAAA